MTSDIPPDEERDEPETWEELMAQARRYGPRYHASVWTPEEAEQVIRKAQRPSFQIRCFPEACTMMDLDAKLLVVRFKQEPPNEVLDAVAEAGFEFRPDYKHWQDVWVGANDYAGWLKFRAIYRLLQNFGPEFDSPAR